MAKKVYFACSIRSGGDTSFYIDLLDAIKSAGGEVLSEIFVHDAIQYGGSPLPVDTIYARDTDMIKEAEFVIAEVSSPSLGVGYEIAYAEKLGKPVLCLYNTHSKKKLSAMIAGNSYVHIAEYSPDLLPTQAIQAFIAQWQVAHRTLQRNKDR